jgi:hypothetical protein
MNMEAASITQHCKTLRLSSIGTQFASLAEEASQQNHSHLRYLEALLQAEVEDRERRSIELRLKDAHLPRMKTLEEFDFAQSEHIPASRIRALAEGGPMICSSVYRLFFIISSLDSIYESTPTQTGRDFWGQVTAIASIRSTAASRVTLGRDVNISASCAGV